MNNLRTSTSVACATPPHLDFLFRDAELRELTLRVEALFYREVQAQQLANALSQMDLLEQPFAVFLENISPQWQPLAQSKAYWTQVLYVILRVAPKTGLETADRYIAWLQSLFEGINADLCQTSAFFDLANTSWFQKFPHQKWSKLFLEQQIRALQQHPFEAAKLPFVLPFFQTIYADIWQGSIRGYRQHGILNPLTIRNLAFASVQFLQFAWPMLVARFGEYQAQYLLANQGKDLFGQWLYRRNRSFALRLFEADFFDFKPLHGVSNHQLFCWLPGVLLGNFNQLLNGNNREFLLHFCRGGSMRTAPNQPRLSTKAAHCFTQLPVQTPFEEAFWQARIAALNGPMALAGPLSQAYYRRTNWDADYEKALILFFSRHWSALDPHEISPLLDFLNHTWNNNPTFSLKGRSLSALRRQMEAWHESVGHNPYFNSGQPHYWKRVPVKGYATDLEQGQRLELIQLNELKSLMEESAALRHCVASYANQCALGHCSIWSLRIVGPESEGAVQRLVTIELSRNGQIKQVRGFANRMPTIQEQEWVAAWCKQEQLNASYLKNG